jgi:Tol biopolymer transport system component
MGIIDDRSARNPIFSMDGSQISFQRRTNNSRYHPFNLFTVPSSGGVIRELTNSYWDDTYPDFSKNGEFISFISNRTGENQVWCLNLNSKLLFQITDN